MLYWQWHPFELSSCFSDSTQFHLITKQFTLLGPLVIQISDEAISFMTLQDCIGVLSKQFPGSMRVGKFSEISII